MKVRFTLKKPAGTTETLIVLRRTIAPGVRFVYSTGEHIEPIFWDVKKGRVKSRHPNSEAINFALDNLGVTCERARLELKAMGQQITRSALKKALDTELGNIKVKERFNLVTLGRRMYAESPAQSPLNSVTNHIVEYSAKYKKPLDFGEIDADWLTSFERYLIEKKYMKDGKENNYKTGTIHRWMVALKTILKQARKLDYIIPVSVLDQDLQSTTVASNKVTLTVGEIQQLYKFEFKSQRLNDARDRLIIACLTGLRHIDWSKLSINEPADQVVSAGITFVKITPQKTQRKEIIVYLPILTFTREAINRMGGSVPQISDTNDLINVKAACKEAGINTRVAITDTRGAGRKETNYFEKWEQVGTHTGRLTWNALLRDAKLPDYLIKLLMGHSAGRDMTDRYDQREFERIAVAIVPFLKEIDQKIVGSVYEDRGIISF